MSKKKQKERFYSRMKKQLRKHWDNPWEEIKLVNKYKRKKRNKLKV